MTGADEPFHFIRARSIFAVIVLCALAVLAAYPMLDAWVGDVRAQTVVELGIYAVAGIVLAFLCRRSGLSLTRLFGPRPTGGDALRTAALSLPLICLSIGSHWFVYMPLSYLAPGLVEDLIAPLPLLVEIDGHYPLPANALVFVTICILAPLVEEFVFRGLLLHRFSVRWSVSRAVVVSSVLFGLGHLDLVGSAIFGVVAAILYLETRSLYHPILLHGANNLLAFGATVAEIAVLGAEPDLDLEAFRDLWWVGALGLALGGPFVFRFLRRHWDPASWRLAHAAVPTTDLAPADRVRQAPTA